MKTKIVNTTTAPVVIREGYFPVRGPVKVASIHPKRTFILHHNPDETFREFFWLESKSGELLELNVYGDEIEICESSDSSELELLIIEPRQNNLNNKISVRPRKYKNISPKWNALKEDACPRMKLIDASCTRLAKLQNGLKICTAQCKNLVETCLEGIEHMKATYDTVFGNDDPVWNKLKYCSGIPRHLISSLDKLLFILETIEDLMRTCEKRWSRMGLYLSTIPFPPSEKKTITKFDILLKELSWNLDRIHYLLAPPGCANLDWDEDKCRYVLQSDFGATDSGAINSGARDVASTEIGPNGTNSLYSEDRKHLLNQVKNESAASKGVLNFTGIYSTDSGNRHYFASEILKCRLQNYDFDNDALPDCFQLNPVHLETNKELSSGNLRKIYSGKWRGEDVAIRVTWYLDQGSRLKIMKEESQKEASLILKVQHPNVVEFYGYAFADKAPPPVSSGNDEEPWSASYLVMELMQAGDLRREIGRLTRKKPGCRPFPDDVTVDILLQIVEAMSHIHDCKVIYRDLKASNCLIIPRLPSKSNLGVGKFYTVKLADFDISKMLDPSVSDHTAKRGTTRWMAPEVWGIGAHAQGTSTTHQTSTRQTSAYDKSIDVYSFGMTCYEVISGKEPFHEYHKNREIEAALQIEGRPVLPDGFNCPGRLVELMSRCWSQKPSDRPDFNEIRKILWTVKYEVEFQ